MHQAIVSTNTVTADERGSGRLEPEPFDRTPAQTIAAYDKDLRDRSSKLIEVQSFLNVLKEELEAGSLQLIGSPGLLDYAMQRLNELTA